MSAKPDLWMPLYFGAYLTDTMHLTTEQHGAYLLLLMACWKRGGWLPNDDEQLAAIVKLPVLRWRKFRPVIEPFWQVSAKGWTQKRLVHELDAARDRSNTATENGKKGGRPKKADGNPDGNPKETGTEPEDNATQNPGESSVPLPRPLQTSGPRPSPAPESQTLLSGSSPDVMSPKAEKLNGYRQQATEILAFLNEKTGRKYRPVDATLKPIMARLREGFDPDDMRAVIASKCRQWIGNEKMDEYLRPKTLFNATNFANYEGRLGVAPEKKAAL